MFCLSRTSASALERRSANRKAHETAKEPLIPEPLVSGVPVVFRLDSATHQRVLLHDLGVYNKGFGSYGEQHSAAYHPQQNIDYSYYGGAENAYDGGLQYPPVGIAGNYRAYPQPNPSPQQYRRSRTAPPKTMPRQNLGKPARGPRGHSAEALTDQKHFRSYSGPMKKPQPMYRKRREPGRPQQYKETEFSMPTGATPGFYFGEGAPPTLRREAPTLRRVHPFYSPSYSTYPPSTMYPMPPPPNHRLDSARQVNRKYPIVLRAVLKIIQLALTAAILGLVLGPAKGQTFHDFVISTKTEWQGAVVGITAVFGILTLALFLSICLANKQYLWRQLDALVTGAAVFLHLFAAGLEAYFASCYPPDGWKLRNTSGVCYRAEWIIATILLFFNFVAFLVDLIFIFRTGVNVL
ncbi:hypothetical protein L596_007540 [Steinernema carpocapsae]|uniref:MARVEL domain-containing protein n=1 Tax=Steinernema carpocapsae TaxID=34508 RepID=A0A4U5PAA3_STECR|nr:hypothetical protein L596_007540 [Steinernema carpocapsae]